MKTPEEMAEEYAEDWHKDCDYPPEILRHTKKATASVFLAGYQAAKDEYKTKISELGIELESFNKKLYPLDAVTRATERC